MIERKESGGEPCLLYCHCAYAKVVPEAVKSEVLRRLGESGAAFDAVADLCEMSARKDPALERIAGSGGLRIAACYPRAVGWLFHAAGSPLPESGVEVINMRELEADEVVDRMLEPLPRQPLPPQPTPPQPTSPGPRPPEPTPPPRPRQPLPPREAATEAATEIATEAATEAATKAATETATEEGS